MALEVAVSMASGLTETVFGGDLCIVGCIFGAGSSVNVASMSLSVSKGQTIKKKTSFTRLMCLQLPRGFHFMNISYTIILKARMPLGLDSKFIWQFLPGIILFPECS